jgi:serine/threonine-protein kinase
MSGLLGDGSPEVGTVLAGKYRVTRLLGRGGMGAVFAAQHEMLGEEVAVKLMLAEAMREPEAVKRFVNEARAAAKIRGEHVVRVLDVGVLDDGRPYISMELMEGEDLGQLLERSRQLPPTVTVDYLLQGMEAIAQAHALGVVHRDLKPSNFFLATRPDGSRIVKVLDFGIAKATGGLADQAMTSTRAMMGSPLYMSPEQIRSSKTVDPQSDLWALGVIAYELIAGTPPFSGESVGELFFAIAEQTPPLVHTRMPGVPPGLSQVIARCLERDKAKRFKTVVDLARALRPFASQAGALEVDRIASVFDRASARGSGIPTGSSSHDVAPPASLVAEIHPAQTNGSWAHSGAMVSAARAHRLPIVLAASGVAAVGAIAIVLFSLGRSHAASPEAGPSAAASAAPAPTASATPAPVLLVPPPVAESPPPLASETAAPQRPAANAASATPPKSFEHPRKNGGSTTPPAAAKESELLKDRNAF